jgi:O-antigen ligase
VRLLKRLQAEVLANPLSAVRPESAAKRPIGKEALERGREPNGVPRRHEQTRVTLLDHLRHAADRRGDHRQRRGHRLEDRERQPFRGARQDEDVGPGEQVRHVAAVPGEHDGAFQAESTDLRLESRPVGPLPDDHSREALPKTAKRTREGERILGRLQAADGQERRRGAGGARWDWSVRSHTVPDHDRSRRVAGPGRKTRLALALGDADRESRQRPHHLLRALVQRRGDAGVSGERPAVNGEDPDRHARQSGGETTEHAGLGAIGMEDVRPLAAEERDELQQTAQIAPRAQWPSDVLERGDARPGTLRRLEQWAAPVRGDHDLELLDEGGEQRGHVRLGSAGLGERDDDHDPGALQHSSPREGNPTIPCAAVLRPQPAWPLVVGLFAVVVFLVWARVEGGYAPTAWYPGAFVLLVLAAVVAGARSWSLPQPLLRAVTFFGLFTLWSFLSITWADTKGDAWDGANRTLLFFTVYALFALLPWRPRHAALLLGVLATGTAALGVVVFFGWAGTEAEFGLLGGRLTDPAGYANANAALFLAAFWPAAVLASRTETPWPARGLFFAVAGLLLQLGVLAQSRGSLPAFALALVLYVALVPDRARALLTLFTIGAATALSLRPLLEVFRADPGPDLQQALAAARTALVVTAVFLAVAGAATGLLDRRLRTGTPRLGRLAVGLLLVVGLAVAVMLVSSGPTSRLGDGLASGRYDLWRVAALEFVRQPLQGVGADNFAVDYARERHRREEPLFPHSIELRLLAQTGLVGTGLFVGFLAYAVAAALRSRRIDATRAALASAGLVWFSYWFAHGSIDWFWEIPALAAPAFAVLGLAGGLSPVAPRRAGGRRRGPRRTIAALGAAGLVAASISYALPWLAARDVEAAIGSSRKSPAGALDRLERARRLNVLSAEPDIVAGVLSRRLGDRERASAAFRRALERAPSDWYPHLQLAVLDLEAGRRTAALLHLEEALRLNPLERSTRALLALARGDQPVPVSLVEQLDRLAVPSPLGRRPVDCRPVLGLAADCAGREGGS